MLKIYILTFRHSTILKIQLCKSCKQILCVCVTAWWAPRRCRCSYHSSPAGGGRESKKVSVAYVSKSDYNLVYKDLK